VATQLHGSGATPEARFPTGFGGYTGSVLSSVPGPPARGCSGWGLFLMAGGFYAAVLGACERSRFHTIYVVAVAERAFMDEAGGGPRPPFRGLASTGLPLWAREEWRFCLVSGRRDRQPAWMASKAIAWPVALPAWLKVGGSAAWAA